MMKLRAALLAALLLAGLVPEAVWARPRGGSSRSSSGRSSSSRSSSSGRSYSSGSRSSTPARSSPARPSPSRPSAPSGKSYSSGRPSAPPAIPASRSPTGKSYASGGSATTGWRPSAPGRLSGGAFDTSAAAAQRRVESRKAYTAGQAPRPTYQPRVARPGAPAESRPIDPTDGRVRELRRQLDQQRWVTRELRLRSYYQPYYGSTVVYYRDPYNSLFWHWLLVQDLNTRARWTYHHRSVMDDARYRDLLRHDARLEARVRELEAEKLPRDPTHVPAALARDADAMYSDEWVDAVVNPQPGDAATPATPPPTMPVAAPAPVLPPPPTRPAGMTPGAFFRAGARFLVKACLVLAALAAVIWLVFIKRWGGS